MLFRLLILAALIGGGLPSALRAEPASPAEPVAETSGEEGLFRFLNERKDPDYELSYRDFEPFMTHCVKPADPVRFRLSVSMHSPPPGRFPPFRFTLDRSYFPRMGAPPGGLWGWIFAALNWARGVRAPSSEPVLENDGLLVHFGGVDFSPVPPRGRPWPKPPNNLSILVNELASVVSALQSDEGVDTRFDKKDRLIERKPITDFNISNYKYDLKEAYHKDPDHHQSLKYVYISNESIYFTYIACSVPDMQYTLPENAQCKAVLRLKEADLSIGFARDRLWDWRRLIHGGLNFFYCGYRNGENP